MADALAGDECSEFAFQLYECYFSWKYGLEIRPFITKVALGYRAMQIVDLSLSVRIEIIIKLSSSF